jgi:hypothetical protein
MLTTLSHLALPERMCTWQAACSDRSPSAPQNLHGKARNLDFKRMSYRVFVLIHNSNKEKTSSVT